MKQVLERNDLCDLLTVIKKHSKQIWNHSTHWKEAEIKNLKTYYVQTFFINKNRFDSIQCAVVKVFFNCKVARFNKVEW